MSAGGTSEHLDDRLSALVDGELSPDEEAAARRHLADCPDCQRELDDMMAVHRVLAGLAPVDPPSGFYDRFVRMRRRRPKAYLAAMVVATAAAWVIAFGVGTAIVHRSVAPPMHDMVIEHRAAGAAVGFQPVPANNMPAPFVAPATLADRYQRMATFHRQVDGIVEVRYANGEVQLSVFEQAGDLDEGRLAHDLHKMDHGASGLWGMDDGVVHAVVMQHDDLVYTLVGTDSMGRLIAIAHRMPDPASPPMAQRVRSAGEEVVHAIGLGN